jgi:parallel beta-helix repeat protein
MPPRTAGRAVVLAAIAMIALLAPPAGAAAHVIQVHPDPNAIQDALAKAQAGDILNVHAGTYRVPDGVDVGKRVTVRSAGDGVVTIDGRCGVQYTILVTASGVHIRGLRVVGAAEGFGAYPAEIDFVSVRGGEVSGTTAIDTCRDTSGDGGAEYGISVFSSGPIQVLDNRTSGFTDSGIYIGAISDTGNGTLRVQDNVSWANSRGVIVEDSSGSIAVLGNTLHHNRRVGVEGTTNAGLFLHNSDGVRIRGNSIARDDENGIWLDADSDQNRVVDNTISGNAADLHNDGSANCFTGNSFSTSTGDVGTAC